MVERIYENPEIYRIYVPLPENPLKNLNCYVIKADDEYLIIDTGFNRAECLDAMEEGLEELQVDLRKSRLFLTHLHSDHSGLAYYFSDHHVPIFMNAIDYQHLVDNLTTDNIDNLDKLFISYGYPKEDAKRQNQDNQGRLYCTPKLFPAILISDGDTISLGKYTFKCIHTPGHSPGHTCLYLEKEELMFSGDHVLFDITPNISMHCNVPDPLGDYMKSLEKISKYPVKITFSGHRGFDGSFTDRISDLKYHHYERLNELSRAISEYGPCSAYELAGHISWSSRGKKWENFSNNQRWFAMGETMTHLILLEKMGKAIRADGNYYIAPLNK